MAKGQNATARSPRRRVRSVLSSVVAPPDDSGQEKFRKVDEMHVFCGIQHPSGRNAKNLLVEFFVLQG
jgi:hypothetical protein